MSESSSFISAWTETTSRSKAAAKDATWSSMISPAASAAAKLAIALRYATAGFGIVVAAGAVLIWTKDIFILLFGFRSPEEILAGIDERAEEHTSKLQLLFSNSYAVLCLYTKKKNRKPISMTDK